MEDKDKAEGESDSTLDGVRMKGNTVTVPTNGANARAEIRVEANRSVEETGEMPVTEPTAVPQAPSPVEPPAVPEVRTLDSGTFFEFDSAEITDSGMEAIRRLRDEIDQSGVIRSLEVAGHADDIGGSEYNLALSERRAEAVRDALIEMGVPEGVIEAKGFGDSMPVATNDTPQGRAMNRRVEITTVVVPSARQ